MSWPSTARLGSSRRTEDRCVVDGEAVDGADTLVQLRALSWSVRSCCSVPLRPGSPWCRSATVMSGSGCSSRTSLLEGDVVVVVVVLLLLLEVQLIDLENRARRAGPRRAPHHSPVIGARLRPRPSRSARIIGRDVYDARRTRGTRTHPRTRVRAGRRRGSSRSGPGPGSASWRAAGRVWFAAGPSRACRSRSCPALVARVVVAGGLVGSRLGSRPGAG